MDPLAAATTLATLVGPERSCVRSTSRSASSVSNPLRLRLRPQPRSVGDLLNAHPHPNPLPQERENRSPVARIANACGDSARSQATSKTAAIATLLNKSSRTAQLPFPLPGGEGQGEGERHNQPFSP